MTTSHPSSQPRCSPSLPASLPHIHRPRWVGFRFVWHKSEYRLRNPNSPSFWRQEIIIWFCSLHMYMLWWFKLPPCSVKNLIIQVLFRITDLYSFTCLSFRDFALMIQLVRHVFRCWCQAPQSLHVMRKFEFCSVTQTSSLTLKYLSHLEHHPVWASHGKIPWKEEYSDNYI